MFGSIKKNNPLISVIIPVYKVEKYLRKCVESIMQQKFTGFELILVDDGSPDNCPAICDEYSRKDERIKVIHKVNGGISDARNAGMAVAQGDFIMFMDGDDYWEGSSFLDKLTERIKSNSADVTLYGTKNLNYLTGEEHVIRSNYDVSALRSNRDNAIRSLFKTRQFPRTAWVLAVRKKLIIENQLYFVKGIKSEDVDWLINVFLRARSFDAVNDAFYIYVTNRPEAATLFVDTGNVKGIFHSLNRWMPVLEADNNPVNRLLLSYLATQYIISLLGFAQLPENEKRKLMPEMRQYRSVLRYADNPRTLVSKAVVHLLGIRAGSRVLLKIYRGMN
jgi:glycosyltransferase involved in cell wall biosynthesis